MNNENKYYVYGHYTIDGDKLFYIGKGSGQRHKKKDRSKLWNEFTSKNAWYAKILHENLTEIESLDLELALIKSNTGLINTATKNKTIEISADVLQMFEYNPASPTGLVWKVDRVGTNGRVYYKKGSVAGRTHPTSDLKGLRYILIVDGQQYLLHRVVYALFNKLDPTKVIDHIDGNSLNNKIENLRQITQGLNAKNTSRTVKGSTGVNGVVRVKRKRLNCVQYIAGINTLDGKRISKEFSSYRLGESEAFRLACEWRKEQLRLLNEQGAGYTDRHGT